MGASGSQSVQAGFQAASDLSRSLLHGHQRYDKKKLERLIKDKDVQPWVAKNLIKDNLDKQINLARNCPLRQISVDKGLEYMKERQRQKYAQSLRKDKFVEYCRDMLMKYKIRFTPKDENELEDVFDAMDFDNSGDLDAGEWAAGLAVFFKGNDDDRLEAVFKTLDKDNSGGLSIDELEEYFRSLVKAMTPQHYSALVPMLLAKTTETIFGEMDGGDKEFRGDHLMQISKKGVIEADLSEEAMKYLKRTNQLPMPAKGWKVEQVNDEKFNEKRLREAVNSGQKYTIRFSAPVDVNFSANSPQDDAPDAKITIHEMMEWSRKGNNIVDKISSIIDKEVYNIWMRVGQKEKKGQLGQFASSDTLMSSRNNSQDYNRGNSGLTDRSGGPPQNTQYQPYQPLPPQSSFAVDQSMAWHVNDDAFNTQKTQPMQAAMQTYTDPYGSPQPTGQFASQMPGQTFDMQQTQMPGQTYPQVPQFGTPGFPQQQQDEQGGIGSFLTTLFGGSQKGSPQAPGQATYFGSPGQGQNVYGNLPNWPPPPPPGRKPLDQDALPPRPPDHIPGGSGLSDKDKWYYTIPPPPPQPQRHVQSASHKQASGAGRGKPALSSSLPYKPQDSDPSAMRHHHSPHHGQSLGQSSAAPYNPFASQQGHPGSFGRQGREQASGSPLSSTAYGVNNQSPKGMMHAGQSTFDYGRGDTLPMRSGYAQNMAPSNPSIDTLPMRSAQSHGVRGLGSQAPPSWAVSYR